MNIKTSLVPPSPREVEEQYAEESRRLFELELHTDLAMELTEELAGLLVAEEDFYDEMSAEEPDTITQILRWVGQVPLLSLEEEVELARQIEEGRLAAERLAKAYQLNVTEIHHWARFRHLERPIPQHLSQVEQCMNQLTNKQDKRDRILVVSGNAALTNLVEANMRLAVWIAKKHTARSGLLLSDLVQEAVFGLVRAAERFDWRRKIKFSTYAHWWIQQSIQRAIARDSSLIRIPMHKRRGKIDGQEAACLEALSHPIYLDEPVGDGDHRLADFIVAEDDPAEKALDAAIAEKVRACLKTLDPELAVIFGLQVGIYGRGAYDTREIAELIGRPPDYVNEKINSARMVLSQMLRNVVE